MTSSNGTVADESPMPELSLEQSVHDTIRWYPSTLSVLNAFGVDTCCGGDESLKRAARTAGIPSEALMTGIQAALVRAITRVSPNALPRASRAVRS